MLSGGRFDLGLAKSGGKIVDKLSDLSSCDIVFSMLPHNAAVKTVALGKGGLIEATSGAKTWIDFSSIDKATIVAANDELLKKGWKLLDASAGAST